MPRHAQVQAATLESGNTVSSSSASSASTSAAAAGTSSYGGGKDIKHSYSFILS